MSWLLVVLIPGLLMLAAFGLERVEAGLRRDAIEAADIDKFLDHAEASDAAAPSRAGTDRARHDIRRRAEARLAPNDSFFETVSAPGLPTRQYVHHLANPEFQQTPHANRV